MVKQLEEISREKIKTRLKVTTRQLGLMQEVRTNAEQSKGKVGDKIYEAMIVGYDSEIQNLMETKKAYERVLKEFS